MSLKTKSLLLIFSILVIDQVVKILVKTSMVIGDEIPMMGGLFRIHFLENNGMAFGMEWGGKAGKAALTVFRLLAIVGICWYLNSLIRSKARTGLILAVSAIVAGATGNLIDSAFYGMIFSESWHVPAVMFPEGGGYSSFLHGRVVDMLYFPIIDAHWPSWSPFRPGNRLFFSGPYLTWRMLL